MILSRVRLLPQQRYDLEDFNAQQSGARTDAKLWTKQFLTDRNSILKGFTVSGIGFNQATVIVQDSTLVMPQNSSDFSWYTVESGVANITVPDSALIDGARNYLELRLLTETNTALVKSFWDPSANSGTGSEFNQQIDTMIDLKVEIVTSTGGFSGSPDRIPLAIVDVDNSGVIKIILDRRELFFRNGTPSDIDEGFTWNSQIEPGFNLVLTGVVGTFQPGEQIQIGSVTARLISGTTSPLVFNCPTGISYVSGSAVTGLTSGASGTVNSVYESFSGADKDIDNFREMMRALMTEIRDIKGTRFWYENSGSSIGSTNKSILFSRFLYMGSDDNLEWSGTELSFTQPIILRYLDPTLGYELEYFIDSALSPLSLNDSDSLYVMISKTGGNQNLTVYNSAITSTTTQDLVNNEAVVLFRRLDNPVSGSKELYIPLNKQFATEGQVFRLGAAGSGGAGGFKVYGYDPISTTLPTGTSLIVDGNTIIDGDLILFTNLTTGNNRVYKIDGVGTAITWSAVRAFENGSYDPSDGDSIIIKEGKIFEDQIIRWNGSEFLINDVVRHFNGVDYWQEESIKKTTLLDAQGSYVDVFSVVAMGSENMHVDFSLIRGTVKEMGALYLTHDGVNVSVAKVGPAIGGTSGIEFDADINSGNLRLRYISTSTGLDAEFKFIIKRWSDASGGPSGVPSYVTSGGSPISAAGANTQIQFNNGGLLGADSSFSWNNSTKTLKIGSTEIQGVNSLVTLNDNQASPATFLSLDATLYKHAMVEYSASINGSFRTGRVIVACDGSASVGSDDFVETSPSGLSLFVAFSAGYTLLQYTTGMTGVTGEIKFNIRKWI